MKKLIALLLLLIMMFSLAACTETSDTATEPQIPLTDGSNNTQTETDSEAPSPEKPANYLANLTPFENVGNDPNNFIRRSSGVATSVSTDDGIFFTSPDRKEVYYVSFDGTGVKKVFSEYSAVSCLNIYKDTLYYRYDDKIMCRPLSDFSVQKEIFDLPKEEQKTLFKYNLVNMQIIDDFLLFAYYKKPLKKNSPETTTIYAIDLNVPDKEQALATVEQNVSCFYFFPNEDRIISIIGAEDSKNLFFSLDPKKLGTESACRQHTVLAALPDTLPGSAIHFLFPNGVGTNTGEYYDLGDAAETEWTLSSNSFSSNSFILAGGTNKNADGFMLGKNLILHFTGDYYYNATTSPYNKQVPYLEEVTEGVWPFFLYEDEMTVKGFSSGYGTPLTYNSNPKILDTTIKESTSKDPQESINALPNIHYHKKGNVLYLVIRLRHDEPNYQLWKIESNGSIDKKSFVIN